MQKFEIKFNNKGEDSLEGIKIRKRFPRIGGGARLNYYLNGKLLLTNDFDVVLTILDLIELLLNSSDDKKISYSHNGGCYSFEINNWQSDKITIKITDTSVNPKDFPSIELTKSEFLTAVLNLIQESTNIIEEIKDESAYDFRDKLNLGIRQIKKRYLLATKTFTIVDVKPDAMENPRNIRTGYFTLEYNHSNLEVFVLRWDSLGFKGKSIEEIKSLLLGKKVSGSLNFVSLGETKKINETIKKIELPNSANQTKIKGEVLTIKTIYNPKQKEYHYYLDVDCNFGIFQANATLNAPDKFKVGDYIEAEGRSDIYIKEIR